MKTISDYASGRENNFDFIRFVASSAVIFSHSFPLTFGNNEKELFYALSNKQGTIGEIAVGIFFIISGFLIAQSYERSKNLERYFLARALRIFPALIVVILVLTFIVGPVLSSLSFQEYFSNSTTWHYLTRMFIFTDEKNVLLPGVLEFNPFPFKINGSLWTLSYELMCYVAVPACALLINRKWIPAIALMFAVLILSLNFLYIRMIARLCGYFFFGSLFYVFRKKVPLTWWLALLSLALLVVSVIGGFFMRSFGLFAGYLVLYLSFVPRSPLFRFAKYGDFSYGIYIWAFPVQQIIAQHYSGKGNYFNAAVSFPLILLLGILSWHLIEKRALALKKKTPNVTLTTAAPA